MIILGSDSKYITALVCTAIHESGHIFAMLRFGSGSIDVKVNLFNISIVDKDRSSRPYRQDIVIICAGPLANIATAVIFCAAYFFCKSDIIYNFAVISAMLAAFNLLPIESTDGGQLLNILLHKLFSHKTANIIITAVTLVFLIPTAVLGFVVLLRSKYNYTLLLVAMYLIVLIVMKAGN